MGAARQERKSRMELAQYEYSTNLEQWNRQNEYNLPVNQMQRLEEAGLNPNLVYGDKNVTGNTVGNAPQYNAPTLKYKPPTAGDFQGMIAGFQDVNTKVAQQGFIEAQTQRTQQQTLNDAINNDILANEAEKSGIDLEKAEGLLPYSLDSAKSKTEQERLKIEGLKADNSIKALVKNEKSLEIAFKKHRNELAKFGIYSSDSAPMRLLVKAANAMKLDPAKVINNLAKKAKTINPNAEFRN